MLPAKLPGETINVTFDFAPTLAKLGVSSTTLSSVTFQSSCPRGTGTLTKVQQIESDPKVVVQLSGGDSQSYYLLQCFATLANGERRCLQDTLPVT